MAERRVLQPWEREALRVCNTDLLRDIVNDNLSIGIGMGPLIGIQKGPL